MEFKNEIEISNSDQFRAQLKIADSDGATYELIVSPRTKVISEKLWDEIKNAGGYVYVYDPATKAPPKLLTERPK